MPKTHVDKSVLINKKSNEVFTILNDFNHWTAWSPWIILEEGVKVKVEENNKFYSWEGDITGSGNMRIISEKENESIEIDLAFLKPWKSTAKVGLILKEEAGGTRVHWTMDGSLPWFMFWMKKMMETFVGMDYQRGLEMLKDYIEDGKVHSKLDIAGYTQYKGVKYIGIKRDGTIDGVSDYMEKDYTKLLEFMKGKHMDKVAGAPFSIYHKWDPIKNVLSYTACVPYSELPSDLLDGMITGETMDSKVHSISHTGSYRHTGNLWSAQYARQRAKKFKMNKKIDPIEIYWNSPKDTNENELKSEVLFAVK